MEPIKDTTQVELREIIDNPIGQAGNRIKLRSVSHENLIRHLKNIPYKAKKSPEIVSAQVNAIKDTKEWNLTPKQSVTYIGGKSKPINVKETMIENIRKHSEVVEVIKPELESGSVSTEFTLATEPQLSTTEITQQPAQPVVAGDDKKEESIMNIANPVQNQMDSIPSAINNDINSTVDITQQILMKKEALTQETREADESDKVVQSLDAQYTEVQRQIQESTHKREEAIRKKMELEKAQSETIRNEIKKYDSLLEEVRARKEKNRHLIEELEIKINTGMEEVRSINADIARIEEETNALSFNNVVNFSSQTDEQQLIKRIA